MLSALGEILNAIVTFIKLLLSGIFSLIDVITSIGTYTETGLNYVMTLPGVLSFFASATISLGIIYLILGRTHGD